MTKRKFQKFGKLPGQPSKLLQIALDDLIEVEKSKNYEIDMDTWHTPFEGGQCAVCMAGAVMSKTLGISVDVSAGPAFCRGEHSALLAINSGRVGVIYSMFTYLELPYVDGFKYDRPITDYHTNKTQFKRDMRRLIKDLAKDGY